MSGVTSSQHLDRELIDSLQAIAVSIFARHGVDFATVQRAGGWTNAVWLAPDLVLRLSTTKGNQSLLREARLAALFPPALGYPALLETGTTARKKKIALHNGVQPSRRRTVCRWGVREAVAEPVREMDGP
jgi:hypothetical protein